MPFSNQPADPAALMQLALTQARLGAKANQVPVGAVVADSTGTILGQAYNGAGALEHAEMLAIAQALAVTGERYLTGCTLAVTLEPCAMCMGAIAHARLARVVFGAYDPKSGGTVSGARVADFSHHKPIILGGIAEAACSVLLTDFFSLLRT